MISIEWKKKILIDKKNYWVIGSMSGEDDLFLGKVTLSIKKGIFLNIRVFDCLLGPEKEIKTWLSKMKLRYTQPLIEEIL